jgi:hypothetical protein
MKKENPFQDRDLNQQLRFPVISWSSYHAFTEYDKDLWYENYVLGNRQAPNKAMTMGVEIGERITQDPTFLPTLERPEVFEYDFDGKLTKFGTLTLRGHIDGYFETFPAIDEYKTSTNKDRWTQKKVDTWGQLTFYALLVWLNHKIPPEKIRFRLWAIPIIEHGDFTYEAQPPIMFTTKRTMADILRFGAELNRTFKEMELFVKEKQNG